MQMILCLFIVLKMEDQVKSNALWDTVFLTVFYIVNCTFWPFTHSMHQCIWCTIHTKFCRNQKTVCNCEHSRCLQYIVNSIGIQILVQDSIDPYWICPLTESRTTCWTNGQDLLFPQRCSRAFLFFYKDFRVENIFYEQVPSNYGSDVGNIVCGYWLHGKP